MNNSNRWQYKYSTPNHQKISMEEIIDFLRKIFFAMLGKDDQQKGTDLRERRKTRLPFPPSPFWKPFNGNTQSPRSGSFIFKIAAMLQIPRVFPRVSCLEVQKRSNAPVPGQKLATKVSKSRAIPQYVPGVNPPSPV